MATNKDHTEHGAAVGGTGAPSWPASPAAQKRMGWLGKLALGVGILVVGTIATVVLWVVWWFSPATLEWKEEVALEDGRTLLVERRVVMVRGGNVGERPDVERERRLTFKHPTTGAVITWENGYASGPRVHPELLDFDGDRPILVTVAQAGADYRMLDCPTPPYIAFRYEGQAWHRIPLADIPRRFVWLNLYPSVDKEFLQSQRYFIRAAVTAALYRTEPLDDHRALFATVDRRIRNPLAFGCTYADVERLYGPGKYDEWKKTGTWLDKTEAELVKLLQKTRGGAKP